MQRILDRRLLGLMLAGALACGPAQASIKWTASGSYCTTGCGTTYSSTKAYNPSVGTGDAVTVTAWANTVGSANQYLERGDVGYWSGNGLGVRNADNPYTGNGTDVGEGSSPEHAMDNNDRFDMLLFDFGSQSISLDEVTLGWYYNDSDISVLAYTGSGNPFDSGNADYLGNQIATDSQETLTQNGWQVIGNYDVDYNDPTYAYTQGISTTVSSSYWLIGAYNPAFGSCPGGYAVCNWPDMKDYMKVLALAGTLETTPPPPPPSTVPEPGTALLLLAGALPWLRSRGLLGGRSARA